MSGIFGGKKDDFTESADSGGHSGDVVNPPMGPDSGINRGQLLDFVVPQNMDEPTKPDTPPPPPTPTDQDIQNKLNEAALAEGKKGRGRAATIFAGSTYGRSATSLLDEPSKSKKVLLGY